MIDDVTHPDPATLAAFLEDGLDQASRRGIAGHVLVCARCAVTAPWQPVSLSWDARDSPSGSPIVLPAGQGAYVALERPLGSTIIKLPIEPATEHRSIKRIEVFVHFLEQEETDPAEPRVHESALGKVTIGDPIVPTSRVAAVKPSGIAHPGPAPEPGQAVKMVTIMSGATHPDPATGPSLESAVKTLTGEAALLRRLDPDIAAAIDVVLAHVVSAEPSLCGLSVDGGTCVMPAGHGGHTQDGGCTRLEHEVPLPRGPLSASERAALLRADADRISPPDHSGDVATIRAALSRIEGRGKR